ncbi:MAG: ATP synthase F1 subunit epsilon [Endomicrobium sp.]|jgi:F-type H+-transporting ATPase subunit epsilon|nr:ATP synthase F1 subunit epsilon [Endomicrobium sp.]
MNKFEIEILSPQGVLFKGNLLAATFPTASGIITVLPGHASLVTKLINGEIVVSTSEEGLKKFSVTNGFIEIENNHVNVISEFATQSDKTNKEKVENAIKLAKAMKEKRKEFVDMSAIESELKRSVVELKSGLGLRRKKV